ncbi:hypothetical protein DYB25_013431 [Aphanomyces astaci]|uniref:Peptidase C1A papain C-terminal domain-containing protein n=1 Tax=Aphanomyces astaci TaxID=112090 RepID=A0A397A2H9_APHAT|nr:hypothetical protein DYB25_013431 [Aphanomyces astaci]
MSAIDLHDVARHFDNKDDDVNPYFVCDGVSIAAFNAYVRGQERLRVGLRFLQLSGDGRLLIVELPNSTVHESTAWEFGSEFNRATGNDREVARRGATTVSRDALPDKEADASFGPRRTTPHRNAPPQGRTIADWLTLVVEVGLSQTWPQLIAAATWWCGYPGIEYILLLKVSADATRFEYRFYDIVTPGVLPDVPTRGFQQSIRPDPRAINIEFNMRRILSIPPNQPLPPGVNQVAVVNLRDIMDSEQDYTYHANASTCVKSKCTAVTKVTSFTDVTPSDEDELKAAVARQPESVAIEADQPEFQFYKSGVFHRSCGTKLDHGVLVVGYGTKDGDKYWKVKNSWGEEWGAAGFIGP